MIELLIIVLQNAPSNWIFEDVDFGEESWECAAKEIAVLHAIFARDRVTRTRFKPGFQGWNSNGIVAFWKRIPRDFPAHTSQEYGVDRTAIRNGLSPSAALFITLLGSLSRGEIPDRQPVDGVYFQPPPPSFFFSSPPSSPLPPTRCYFTALGELARFARCKNLLPSSYLIRINAESRVTASNVFTRDETSVIWSWRVVDGNERRCLLLSGAECRLSRWKPSANFFPSPSASLWHCVRLVSRGLIIFLRLRDAFLLRNTVFLFSWKDPRRKWRGVGNGFDQVRYLELRVLFGNDRWIISYRVTLFRFHQSLIYVRLK